MMSTFSSRTEWCVQSYCLHLCRTFTISLNCLSASFSPKKYGGTKTNNAQLSGSSTSHFDDADSETHVAVVRKDARKSWREEEDIAKGINALRYYRRAPSIASKMNISESVFPLANTGLPDGHPPILMEQDFTTLGTQGTLGCPFTAMIANKNNTGTPPHRTGRSRRPNSIPTPPPTQDPIIADIYPQSIVSGPQSSTGCALKCPIRFLDQHSPEEIAEYYENHKHELPRSHQFCVKRFQSNAASIQELDAKYGSLVNMIQGLGEKHKPMLPMRGEEDNDEGVQMHDNDDDAATDLGKNEKEKIEKWAEDLSTDKTNIPHDVDEPRVSHFDKPLRDIRVGESPSRPWGIHVPLTEDLAVSSQGAPACDEVKEHSATSKRGSTSADSILPSTKAKDAAPRISGIFAGKAASTVNLDQVKHANRRGSGFSAAKAASTVNFDQVKHENLRRSGTFESNNRDNSRSDGQTRGITISGPVFIGYSAEDAAVLLQKLGNSL